MNERSHRRRRSQRPKSVSTTEELVLNRLLTVGFVIVAVVVAAYLTMIASRR